MAIETGDQDLHFVSTLTYAVNATSGVPPSLPRSRSRLRSSRAGKISVLLRHPDIRYDRIGTKRLEHRQREARRSGRRHISPQRAEEVFQCVAGVEIVIDDEDRETIEAGCATTFPV